MEVLSSEIINSINQNKTNIKDKYQEINLKTFKPKTFDNADKNIAINLSYLDSKDLVEVLKQNKKLLKDFFKFGLYRQFDSIHLSIIFKTFKVPSNDLQSLLEHIFELRDSKLLCTLLIQNVHNFTEKEILSSINFILSENNENSETTNSSEPIEDSDYLYYGELKVFLISVLLRTFIDRKYFFSLLKEDKKNNLFKSENLIIFFEYLKKCYNVNKQRNNMTSDNLQNYFLIVSDLFMFALLNKQIFQQQYDLVKQEIEDILAEIKLKQINSAFKSNETSSVLKFYKYSNRDDFLVERIKI